MDMNLATVMMDDGSRIIYKTILANLTCEFPDATPDEIASKTLELFKKAVDADTINSLANPLVLSYQQEEFAKIIEKTTENIAEAMRQQEEIARTCAQDVAKMSASYINHLSELSKTTGDAFNDMKDLMTAPFDGKKAN